MIGPGFALRNCLRRPVPTVVSLCGVALAVGAFFSLLAFRSGYTRGLRNELDRLGAHILVVPKGCPYDAASIALHGARWPCYLKMEYLEEVQSTAGIATAAPVFMSAQDDATGEPVVYAGVDRSILALKRQWRLAGRFPEQPGELLVGSAMAEEQSWRVGDRVKLPGMEDRQGEVSAVLAPTGGPDDRFIYLRLADAQQLFGHPAELTHILVRLADPETLDLVSARLRTCGAGLDMNIVPLAHLFRTIQSLMQSTHALLAAVALIGFLVAGAGVANTVLMAVSARTREIGILRAIGASRAEVFKLFWMETLFVCLAGSVVGIAAASLGSAALEEWLRGRLPFAPTGPMLSWQWWIAGASVACGLALGTVAALLPASRAAGLPPSEAMRSAGGWA